MLVSKEFHLRFEKTPVFRHKPLIGFSKETDLLILRNLRLKHRKNPLIGYLNINSLRNKISDLSVFLTPLAT